MANDVDSTYFPFDNGTVLEASSLHYDGSTYIIDGLQETTSTTLLVTDSNGDISKKTYHTDKYRSETEIETFIANSTSTNYEKHKKFLRIHCRFDRRLKNLNFS